MPGEEDFDARDRRHLEIDAFRERADYGYPKRKQERKPVREDYAAHAQGLLAQLGHALGAAPAAGDRIAIEGLKPGRLVQVETLEPQTDRVKAVKLPAALEFPAQDIVVLHTERTDERTESAVLFIPDDAQAFLRGRIAEYGRDDLGNRKRPDVGRFESIETIQGAAAEALFVGTRDPADQRPAWWELWVRAPAARADALAHEAARRGFDVHPERLLFPETVVVFVHGRAVEVLGFAGSVPGAVSEIRRATGTIAPFLDQRPAAVGQHDFVADLGGRITPPPNDAPSVCVLDTGIAAAHPLLAPALASALAYDEAWGADDHHHDNGHGTGMASLALYGDLQWAMNDQRQVTLTHTVESVKLLPPPGFPRTPPPSYGVVTQGAVSLAEIERPLALRSFCLATTADVAAPTRPSSWSGGLDQICAGAMAGDRADDPPAPASRTPKRLMVVAIGNTGGGSLEQVMLSQPLEDPAQSWNVLTVGGYTAKDVIEPAEAALKPVVGANQVSPFSRTSENLPDDLLPIKPEVLFEAGNMVMGEDLQCSSHLSLSLLAAGKDVANEPLTPFWATSAAAGMGGNFIGRLMAQLPGYWPETYRALAVQSAEWPAPIRKELVGRGAHWKTKLRKGQRQQILRRVGYGVPNVERALMSARNDLTLIAQAEIQPFMLNEGRAVYKDMHFYDLPWPREALERLENTVVMMKVVLSYFVEPNLTGKAATRPDTYRSFGLRFGMKKRTETAAKFRSRINAAQATDGAKGVTESDCWLLGPNSVQAGSLHCDTWRGYAVDLAGHDELAVFPVGGWWKSHLGQRRANDVGRYALTISISAPGQAVDLHAEVSALVDAARVGAGAVEVG